MTVRKILSVDDEEEIEFLMKQYFRRKIRSGEYEFFFASTGVEGLAVLNDHPDIDIILCDINMPEMDGLTMLSKVNEMQNPAQRVIMVSAYGDLENIRLAMNDGAFDFATKPIDMDDLARTIEKAIRQIDFVHESQKEHKKLEGLERDLAAANQIQQFILPRVFPPFPEDSDKLDICASMEAAKDVGGDFYDFFRIDDDRIALVIADVCGKGIPAALYMAVSRTVIRTKGIQSDSPGVCMAESNHMLASYSFDYMFVTVFYAVYNTKTGLVTYCNAGHIPPHVLRVDGTTEELPYPENMVLGLKESPDYKESTLQLDHGDTLVMFTDGVTEAIRGRSMFGSKRLDLVLGGQIGNSSQKIIEGIKTGINAFVGDTEQNDDITMLVLKRK